MSPQYRARGLFYVFSVAVFAIVAAATILYALGYHIDVAHQRISKSGLVVLGSTPKRAYVTINGSLRPERTNARIKLNPGSYDLKVDEPGVIPWQKHVELSPGEALIDDNILLFAKQPETQALSAEPVIASALAPNGRTVAFLRSEPGGVGVWSIQLGGQPEKLATLPAAYAKPAVFTFSTDGSRVLAATGSRAAVAGSGVPVQTIRGSGWSAFAPGERDRVVGARGSRVLLGDLKSGRETTAEQGVTAWTTSPNALYAMTAKGLIRHDLRTGDRKTFEADALTSLQCPRAADTVFGLTAAGAFYGLENGKLVKLADDVERYSPDQTGDLVALSRNRELTLWKRSDGSLRLVTRSSDAYDALAVVTDGHYLLYLQGGQLHAIALDGTNDQSLLRVPAGGFSLAAETTVVSVTGKAGLAATRLLPR